MPIGVTDSPLSLAKRSARRDDVPGATENRAAANLTRQSLSKIERIQMKQDVAARVAVVGLAPVADVSFASPPKKQRLRRQINE